MGGRVAHRRHRLAPARARGLGAAGPLTVVLRSRADLDLEAYRRVAWGGEAVELAAEALARIGECRRSFLALVDSGPDVVVYGVTSGYGERARIRLSPEERREQGSWPPRWADASFGEPMPERLVRGIVLARLANFVEGHAAVRPELAEAVAGMLGGAAPLPEVALHGNGDAGEIVALSRLFGDLGDRVGLREKEALALINGSPCAAAALADAALAGRNRLRLAHEVFALSVEALAAPLEAYAPELEELWGDEHETLALRILRGLLEGTPIHDRRPYQAPVSYRILPRVLGEALRALAAVEEAAETSLRSVSDNPVYLPPDAEHPLGRVRSTGGYHNGVAYPALDRLAATWANLCQLADRHGERLIQHGNMVPADSHRGLGVLLMVLVGRSEEARTAAQPTILPRGSLAQNDVTAPAILAWEKEQRAGRALDASLAVLAALGSQALHDGELEPAPPLRPLLAEVREAFPPVTEMRALRPSSERLAGRFRERIDAVEEQATAR